MSLPVSRELTRQEYERLLQHASQQPDFAYIGSVGDGEARGLLCGFSALSSDELTLSGTPEAREPVAKMAARMEKAVTDHTLSACASGDHLSGGWIGFLSYELGYIREDRLANLCPDLDTPLVHAGFYLWTASYNRKTRRHYLWIHPDCAEPIRATLSHWLAENATPVAQGWEMTASFTPRQSSNDFLQSVGRIRQYIDAGDCYQVNLSQEFSGRFRGDPWKAFQALATANPTPYSAFIRAGRHSILSISPERFLEIQGNTILTSPIKGTRPRGSTPEQDLAYSEELLASEKDRAENLMIVDLLRNDLGVSAQAGTVAVDELFALESYQNVHHLVSHIRARLREDVSPMQALIDAFPGGSITGAPKIRAMEIIRELEPHWRGPYCGSVFYRGLNGTLDSNIAIRTLLCDASGTIRCWGGGGIVADSDPQAEYEETLTKVRPLMEFLERFQC